MVRDEDHNNDSLGGTIIVEEGSKIQDIVEDAIDDEPYSTSKGDLIVDEMKVFKKTSEMSDLIDVSIGFFK